MGRGDFKVASFQWAGGRGAPQSPLEQAARLRWIVQRLREFIPGGEVGRILVEDYAYSRMKQNQTKTILQLAELVGAVKVALYEHCGVAAEPVSCTSVRSRVLGFVPKAPPRTPESRRSKVVKQQIADFLRRMMRLEFPDDDCADAYLIARYGIGLEAVK